MISRWVVLEHHQVTEHDVADGHVTPDALKAWAMSAREDYLGQNHELHGLVGHGMHLDHEMRRVEESCLRLGAPSQVAVSASVVEVHEKSFTLNTRIRALDTDEQVAATVTTVIRIVGDDGTVAPIDKQLRDAIIALEHGARHYN